MVKRIISGRSINFLFIDTPRDFTAQILTVTEEVAQVCHKGAAGEIIEAPDWPIVDFIGVAGDRAQLVGIRPISDTDGQHDHVLLCADGALYCPSLLV